MMIWQEAETVETIQTYNSIQICGFVCQCSECSLKLEDFEENERMKTEIREKDIKIAWLSSEQ